jgi:hypothetical protein
MKTFSCLIIILLIVFQFSTSQVIEVNAFSKVDPPSVFLDRVPLQKTATSIFQTTFTKTVGDSVELFFPIEAQTAFLYATDIWSYLINSFETIRIKAVWDTVDPNYAIAQTDLFNSLTKNFTGAPYSNVLYPFSLAEAIAQTNMNGDSVDIVVQVSSKWKDSLYFGTDGNTPAGKVDFVSVILHEIGHGLGIASTFTNSKGKGKWGSYPNYLGFPSIYDIKLQRDSVYGYNNLVTQYENNSTSMGDQITSNSVYFQGLQSFIMNKSVPPKIYAPSHWKDGVSINHLDNTYWIGNSNGLMRAGLARAEAIHSPGEVGLSILEDMGWSVNRVITISSPAKDVVWVPGIVQNIIWTDNKGGSADIKLWKEYPSGFSFLQDIQLDYSSEKSTNVYAWYVPTSLEIGKNIKFK